MKTKLLILFICLTIGTGICAAQTTAFTYQGKLNDGGTAANGNYDMAFRLYDAVSAGTQIGSIVLLPNTPVANGIFSVELDFGAVSFATNLPRFLEISVRQTGNPNPPTMLSPRQKITSSPFAIKSLQADSADSATLAISATSANSSLDLNCSLCVSDAEIQNVSGNKVTGAVNEAATISTGAGGDIVNILDFNGFIATISGGSAVYVFYGDTVSLTVPSGTTKTIAGSVTTTLSTSVGSVSIRYALCSQSGSGSVNIFRNASLTKSVTTTRSSFSYSGSTSLNAGTYTVGFCVLNSGSTITQSAEQITGYIIAPK